MTTAAPASIMGIPVKRAPLGANRSDGNFVGAQLGIFHDIEGSVDSALALFASPGDPREGGGSTQFVADPARGCFWQLVDCNKVAYGCGNYDWNKRAIQIELPGFAGRLFDPNVADYAARFAAWLKVDSGIPIERVSFDMLRSNGNVRGLTGHMDIPDPNNAALRGGQDHHGDPGLTFPWAEVLDKAARYAAGSPPLPPTGPAPDLHKPTPGVQSLRWPTGFRVGGGFYGYWASLGGALPVGGAGGPTVPIAIFGYPISRVFVDEGGPVHIVVQYFERARMEKWPDGRITLGLVGRAELDARARFLPAEVTQPEAD